MSDKSKMVQSCPLLFQEREDFPFACGQGWHSILFQLCRDIEALISAMTEEERCEDGQCLYAVAQVKEKFGGLRFYMHQYPDGAHELISQAEDACLRTCETCGAPGVLRRTGWVSTLCDAHYAERVKD